MSTATATPPKTALAPLDKLKGQLAQARDKLCEVAPKYMSVDRLTRLLLLACGKSPKILACTPESILQFGMKCAETGLEPIGAGGCWPIPYGTTLTFIPDYRGLVHCATRNGCIKNAFAEVVRENDEFDYELGLEPSLTHKPARGDRGELDAAYCVFELPDGTKRFTVMDRKEIVGIRSRSKASNSGPWVTDESEMWKKTVIRRAMKPFAGMSSALDAAIEADNDQEPLANGKAEVSMPRAKGELPAPAQEPATDKQPDLQPGELPPEAKEEKKSKPISKAQTTKINALIAELDLPASEVESICGGDVAALTEKQADEVWQKLLAVKGQQSAE